VWRKDDAPMIRAYRFIQVDVFTDRVFGGNPLAVFPDAEGLSDLEMQQLAREMNLSETTFVLPPQAEGADFKVRIFTPAAELPFAGHPVVGTHWVLARLGRVQLQEPVTTVRFELGVGVLPADVYGSRRKVRRVVMTQGPPTYQAVLADVSDLATGLGIRPAAILSSGLPVQVVSTGVPQMMVPMWDLEDVRTLDVGNFNIAALTRACQAVDTDCVHVFCPETESEEATVHVRMFAPLLGVAEDPATGSSNGAMGAYLVHHAQRHETLREVIAPREPTTHIISEQGLEMGRPSLVHVEVDSQDGQVSEVRVGGQVVPVAEGVVSL
jgi:trans-2,3-dihydro-3-hydroxyanthranilate isomerase